MPVGVVLEKKKILYLLYKFFFYESLVSAMSMYINDNDCILYLDGGLRICQLNKNPSLRQQTLYDNGSRKVENLLTLWAQVNHGKLVVRQ